MELAAFPEWQPTSHSHHRETRHRSPSRLLGESAPRASALGYEGNDRDLEIRLAGKASPAAEFSSVRHFFDATGHAVMRTATTSAL
jgi:hypothetical protein